MAVTLSEFELRMMREGRCIVCGSTFRKDIPPPNTHTCKSCWNMSRHHDVDRAFGARQAGLGHEFRRRMGYGPRDGSAPKKEEEES